MQSSAKKQKKSSKENVHNYENVHVKLSGNGTYIYTITELVDSVCRDTTYTYTQYVLIQKNLTKSKWHTYKAL